MCEQLRLWDELGSEILEKSIKELIPKLEERKKIHIQEQEEKQKELEALLATIK